MRSGVGVVVSVVLVCAVAAAAPVEAIEGVNVVVIKGGVCAWSARCGLAGCSRFRQFGD